MDSPSVVASGGHKNKPSKRKRPNTYEGPDRISDLPDSVLSHILYFLPTKDAVSTCVLSKRWIYLWTFVTNLSFQDRNRYRSKKSIRKDLFLNFVNRVLLNLNHPNIQSFSLFLCVRYDSVPIENWIYDVLHRGVKRLCLNSEEKLDLPSYSLLKFQSIEELVLMMNSYAIIVSNPVCLSSLTVLKLAGITITPDSFNNSEELCLKFPVLRKYEANNCSWQSFKTVIFEVPLLEVLSVTEFRKEFPSDGPYTMMMFCASHLIEFNYTGYILPGTILLDPSTTKVDVVNITPHKFEEQNLQVGITTCNLLKQFNRNAYCLKIQMWPVYGVAKDSFADLPAFEILSRLELQFVSVDIIFCLLLRTPFLKILVIKALRHCEEPLSNSAIVPDCFLSNLQVVEFGQFYGSELAMSLVKFVMENAKVLERMIFFYHNSKFEEVKEKLFSFNKVSTSAIIECSYCNCI